MIRGAEPLVTKNPFVLDGTPAADFKISRAGLFLVFNTKVKLVACINEQNKLLTSGLIDWLDRFVGCRDSSLRQAGTYI